MAANFFNITADELEELKEDWENADFEAWLEAEAEADVEDVFAEDELGWMVEDDFARVDDMELLGRYKAMW